MAAPAMRWRHVIINTKCSWLPGDKRGFRTWNHRLHSTGDYRNPPPAQEHLRLRDHMQAIAADQVIIPADLRIPILRAIVVRLRDGYEVLAASVADKHAHALVRLPDHRPTIRQIIGQCKRHACYAVASVLPGSIWSAGGAFEPVDTLSHQRRTYNYIYEKQGLEAATWSYKDDVYRAPPRHPGRR